MLPNLFSYRQFWLIKWSFFVQSTMCNAAYVQQRFDSILKLCHTFPVDSLHNTYGLPIIMLYYCVLALS